MALLLFGGLLDMTRYGPYIKHLVAKDAFKV